MPHRLKEEAPRRSQRAGDTQVLDDGCKATPSCQVPGCRADIARLPHYYARYRICQHHVKATQVALSDCEPLSRFCQLCGRFHALDAFDDARRSCRARLAKHNARRKLKLAEREAGKIPTLAALTEANSSGDSGSLHHVLDSCPGDLLLNSTQDYMLSDDNPLMCMAPLSDAFDFSLNSHSSPTDVQSAQAYTTIGHGFNSSSWQQPSSSASDALTPSFPLIQMHAASAWQAPSSVPPSQQLAPVAPSYNVSRAQLLGAHHEGVILNQQPRPSSWPFASASDLQALQSLLERREQAGSAAYSGVAHQKGPSAQCSCGMAANSRHGCAFDVGKEVFSISGPLAVAWGCSSTSAAPADSELCRMSEAAELAFKDTSVRALGDDQTLDALWDNLQGAHSLDHHCLPLEASDMCWA